METRKIKIEKVEKKTKNGLRDKYLESLRKDALDVYDKVMDAMVDEIVDVIYEEDLKKALKIEFRKDVKDIRIAFRKESDLNKAFTDGKILVPVIVNSKHGSYESHRWKGFKEALSVTKDYMKKKENIDVDKYSFKNKKTGKVYGYEELFKELTDKNSKVNFTSEVKENFILVKKAKEKAKTIEKPVFKEYNISNGTTIKYVRATPEVMAKKVDKAKETVNPTKAWRVDSGNPDELRGNRNYVTEGGSTISIKSDGDIVAVCRNNNDTVSGHTLLKMAVEKGGIKLDSFDGNNRFYQRSGFEPISWCKFERKFAPPDWKEEYGEEQIIFYAYTGKMKSEEEVEKVEDFYKRVKISEDYDKAKNVRNDFIKAREKENGK